MALLWTPNPRLLTVCSRTIRLALVRHIADVATEPAASLSLQYGHTRLVPNITTAPKSSQAVSASISSTRPNATTYSIKRTPTRGLPVYELAKAGGNLKLTRVRKLEGNRERLKKDLERYLMPKPEYVKINPVTGHVVVKGWYKTQIDKFLIDQGF